ncbi:contact-dependent growth inhibition system immunity protein [Cedecea neteri]|uniref:contact-dependent growth inhibition system immunity protein n=1 Tax=Cedecea neteri TaxID=158822 RepID=UPI002AA8B08B|nr:contact-dependent growth inhibition system immunity protein [Cedecea neteri]WPU24806.1 contact-dependent growth inhibition system immunity protein [Cedecea neteri]
MDAVNKFKSTKMTGYMTTFRELLLNNHVNYEKNRRSSLDEWFGNILDVPLSTLEAGDIARAIRQSLFLSEVLPVAEELLKQDPLAGEKYDGELISSIASLSRGEIESVLPTLRNISSFLHRVDKKDFESSVIADVEKIAAFIVVE